ncbi:phosphocarrier, HPr family [Leptospira meyeri serovar Hardjo str. Went 5]|nr:phosphocarrier, HPr family [Leptospira meyeri serovar Hardjo str. Went 5]
MAASFPCEIFVIKDDIEVNGKSIMGLMMLALGPGSIFFVKADGKGEEEALRALEALVGRNFETNAT